jgi:hypothetical protein
VFVGYNFRIVLKYLAILVLVLGCAFIVARHDEYTALESTQKSIVKSNPALTAESNENHPQKNPKNSAWDSPSGHIFRDNAFRWPEGTTVWAILLTLMAIAEQTLQTRRIAEAALRQTGVMAGQLEEMKRQADLMEQQAAGAREAAAEATTLARQSAEAATTNAEALINSERAWVNVEIDEPPFLTRDASGNGIVWIRPKVKNYGRTPARVEMIIYRPHQIPKDDRFPKPPQLPAEPDYVSPETVYTDLQAFLPPTAAVVPLQIPVPELDFAAIRGRAVFLYIYGQVLYRDMLETGRGAKFCYVYWVPDDPADPNPEIFMTDGNTPQAYLEYT